MHFLLALILAGNGSSFDINRNGNTLLSAGGHEVLEVKKDETVEPVKPVHLGYPHGPSEAGGIPEGTTATTVTYTISGDRKITGTITAGTDSWACIPEDAPRMVRTTLGQSRSLLNRGVYDREGDWVVYFDANAQVRITPSEKPGTFSFKASGKDMKIILKPEFMRKHRGLLYYQPSKYKLWNAPVAGWCSWAAHVDGVTEGDVVAAADMVAEKLLPYGCDIIQIDDGFQTINQHDPDSWPKNKPVSEGWSECRPTFPRGMKWLAGYIREKGLVPGIWMGCFLPLQEPKEWYISRDGEPYRAKWVDYAVDGNSPQAVEDRFQKTYRAFREQGWEYFKVDTIRHVLYDNYRMCPEHFSQKGEVMEESFRKLYQGIRQEIGNDHFMLSCWGTIPEMVGIADGCRIGEDVGPDWASIQRTGKYVSRFAWMNNVIWRDDPDYMCLQVPFDEAKTWVSFIALTGMSTMISDPASSYDDKRLEIFRKALPPLFIRPTTLEPVDSNPALWLLEVNKPFESWNVLCRIAWGDKGLEEEDVSLASLGLEPEGEYLVFDFWNERFLGTFKDRLHLDKLKARNCRVYGIRKKLTRPQVLSTSRHISQGGFELEGVTWKDEALSGKLKVVKGDPVRLFIHLPEGYRVKEVLPEGAKWTQSGSVTKLEILSGKTEDIGWQVKF